MTFESPELPLADEPPLREAPPPSEEPTSAVELPAGPPAWPRVGAVLSGALDLVTQARGPLRNGSLYIGFLGLISMGPAALALVAIAANYPGVLDGLPVVFARGTDPTGSVGLAIIVAGFMLTAIGVDAQVIGLAILGGQRVDRPLTLREAVRRARTVFWRIVRASIIVGAIEAVVTAALGRFFVAWLGPDAEGASIGATVATSLLTAPLVYVQVGIVLGDVGAWQAVRRSVRLARARFRLAVLSSLFGLVTQFLLSVALSTGLDLVVRAVEPFRGQLANLDVASVGGFAVVGLGTLVALFALWTLTFTVSALTAAPQVVAFLGLTGYSGGLDQARDEEGGRWEPKPRWVSLPMAVGSVIAALFAFAALATVLH